MDLISVIGELETGDQDVALVVLQIYNKENAHCFAFNKDEESQRESYLHNGFLMTLFCTLLPVSCHCILLLSSLGIQEGQRHERLGELVLGFLGRELQPSCQLACLETVRILSRDQHCLEPFVSRSSMATLAAYAGIDTAEAGQKGEEEGPMLSGEAAKSQNNASENPDAEVIVEALKSLCNILLHNATAQAVAEEMHLMKGVAGQLKQFNDPTWSHEVRFFYLRLTFLLTALRVNIRTQLAKQLHGISLLGNQLDCTLGLSWSGPCESSRAGLEGVSPEDLPPLSREQTERAMEILKILFNITFNTSKSEVDEEDTAEYRHLGAILRHCLMSREDGEERTEEFHSHTVNLLGNLPLRSLEVLLTPRVQPGSVEHMGVNMDAVHTLLRFMEKRLDRGHKLKESLLPCLNLLSESARIHRETRKFLRSKVLPPLRDVKNRPEVGSSLRNKLVRLMTHIDTDVKTCVAELIFVLCKESVSRFIKYTGYGNAAGLLAARGLLRGTADSGVYSDDEDSETEEYREAKALINPVTGVVEEAQSNPMEGMTEEQKEQEAMKLVTMFDKLSRNNIIQPMQLGMDGRISELNEEDIRRLVHNPLGRPQAPTPGSDSDEGT